MKILYLAAFHKNIPLQTFLIEIGLDPEVAKGRLEVYHPEKLAYLRQLRILKIIKFANKLDNELQLSDVSVKKMKL